MNATWLATRSVVRLSAADAAEDVRGFLQGLVTNDVSGDLPLYAALLSAQGKTMFDFFVWGDGQDILLDCEAVIADELVKRLSLYRLRRKIEIGLDPDLSIHWSIERAEHASPDPRNADIGFRWVAPARNGEHSADNAYLSHRLALGVPEGRSELGDILWLETNAVELNGVSFEKGCYIGQENTARMNWRQKVNRRLVVVPLEQSNEKRRMAEYPRLGLAVDHLRIADIDVASLPAWQRAGLED